MKTFFLAVVIPAFLFAQANIKNVPWRATGNGVADDITAIQATVDAVAASGGGTVVCPSGTYSISHAIAWTAADVYLVGDGGCRIVPAAKFTGDAAIVIGKPSAILNPTYRGGISNITVDLSNNTTPTLIGVELIQTWFTSVNLLRITNPNGLATPRQTAFQMHAGELVSGAPWVNWSSNNSVSNLQISGSFQTAIRHVSGCQPIFSLCQGAVNRTMYFGGFGFETSANKAGTYGIRIESGDTTHVYGMAFEDFDVCAYVGTQNNGPLDLILEDCTTQYKTAPGQTVLIPATTIVGQ